MLWNLVGIRHKTKRHKLRSIYCSLDLWIKRIPPIKTPPAIIQSRCFRVLSPFATIAYIFASSLAEMAAVFRPHVLPMIGLLIFLQTARPDIFFNKLELKGTLFAVKQTSCVIAKQLKSIPTKNRLRCARTCSLDPQCRAILYSEPSQCTLLSSPWKWPAAGQTLMIARLQHPSMMTWHYKGSEYIVTKEKGDFLQIKAACAARGMHLWYPDSREEVLFVEKEILCYLWGDYIRIPSWDHKMLVYDVWIGVIDRPNGVCYFADERTICPVKNYLPKEPSTNDEECTTYWWSEGKHGWIDTKCKNDIDFYGLCEKGWLMKFMDW